MEPRSEFAVLVTPGSNDLRVTVTGELDIAVADELYNIVLKDLSDGTNLILDFAGVTFCDSSGIKTLVRLFKHQADVGGTLRLINTADAVRRVIEIAGLARYLGINREG